jgi:hypothetical protein
VLLYILSKERNGYNSISHIFQRAALIINSGIIFLQYDAIYLRRLVVVWIFKSSEEEPRLNKEYKVFTV